MKPSMLGYNGSIPHIWTYYLKGVDFCLIHYIQKKVSHVVVKERLTYQKGHPLQLEFEVVAGFCHTCL